tara:strand:+ start:1754 stop:2434 length:681 start_codon:yes stop_codon:yes gene_type:complete
MKKPLKIVLISIGLIFLLYHILSWTRILTIYSDLKTSNLPTLELDTKLITTNLIKPKNGDFILYSNEKNVLRKTAVNRLCGKENDIVEIKYGTLFINGENFDKELNLIYFYTLSKTEYKRVKSELKKEIRFHSKTGNKKDSIMILLSYNYARKNNFENRRNVAGKFDENSIVQKIFKEDWNLDNFGPLKIPKNKYFVLGDNRDTAQDSRFVGLIDKSDIVGTVINK